MNYIALILITTLLLLSLGAGCIQPAPVENTTNFTVIPTESVSTPTVSKTVVETTTLPTKPTISQPVLSENDNIYVKNMENRLDEMYGELERRQTEMKYTVWGMENDSNVHLSKNTIRLLDSAVENGYGYSEAISGILKDVLSPVERIDGTFEYWTLTEYGKTVLNKLSSYDEGISQQKKDIVIQKRRINDFYKEKDLPAPYDSEMI